MGHLGKKKIAIWSLTRHGAKLAVKIRTALEKQFQMENMVPAGLSDVDGTATPFDGLKATVADRFRDFQGHIFIMAAGIAVRMTAPVIRHKTKDPAVVVVDEQGRHAVSLLSGHIGGANTLAREVSSAIGAVPVITTATDINGLPAIDEIAAAKGLVIENPGAIKMVHMAMLEKNPIRVYDPYGFIRNELKDESLFRIDDEKDFSTVYKRWANDPRTGVFVDDKSVDLHQNTLLIRPRHIVAGIGCNRNTPEEEIVGLIDSALTTHGISMLSIDSLASIDIKHDEPGLKAAAGKLGVPIRFFSSKELNLVNSIQNPSETVRRVTGAQSVCEAAAILGAGNGPLIIPKTKTRNVTLAVARTHYTS